MESYTGTVQNETIVITVPSLSPFMIAIKTSKGNASTGKNPFVDVKANDWFYEKVTMANQAGLMQGTSATTFEPNCSTTRAIIVTVLYNMAGKPTMQTSGTEWYAKASVWAMSKSISDGTDMKGIITREQIVTMLWRNAGEPKVSNYTGLTSFSDGKEISNYAQQPSRGHIRKASFKAKETKYLTLPAMQLEQKRQL